MRLSMDDLGGMVNVNAVEKPVPDFIAFRKIPRFSRDIEITEKIDGSNAQILIKHIDKDYYDKLMLGYWYGPDASTWAMYAGKRTSWITPERDNFGFAAWAKANFDTLKELGPGLHFGEWWGANIQRKYGIKEKRFSLFNTKRWGESRPSCCHVVPVLYSGQLDDYAIHGTLAKLATEGSLAAPGFMKPEGIVIYHTASGHLYKKTIEDDEKPKGAPASA